MTKFLASVRTVEEAELACAGGADVIDVKDPARGALGRLPDAVIREIVDAVAGRRPVSATIGDMELDRLRVTEAVRALAETGVDIVKIGMFPGDAVGTLACLKAAAIERIALVAVFLADRNPDFTLLDDCHAAGFHGVMLDTADKASGPLTCHFDETALRRFIALGHEYGFMVGLAGSLRRDDVARLGRLRPDYLGFRSALTAGRRHDALDTESIAAIRGAINAVAPVATMG